MAKDDLFVKKLKMPTVKGFEVTEIYASKEKNTLGLVFEKRKRSKDGF